MIERFTRRERQAQRERERVGLALLHEYCHRDLAHLPFSLLKKYEMLIFYSMILEAVGEKGESIEVPFNAETPRSPLEKQWALVVELQRESELVQEVYAIRSSLENASDEGYLAPEQMEEYVSDCKIEYETYIPLFGEIYDAFDLIWRTRGKDKAQTIIFSVLETLHPDQAFINVLSRMYQSDLRVPSDGSRRNLDIVSDAILATGPPEWLFHFFREVIDGLDREDHARHYYRTLVLAREEKIKEEWHTASQDIQDDIGKFLLGSPNTILFSHYNRTTHRFSKLNVTEEVRGHFIIVLEAIRQQLTTGRGLLCPFWGYVKGMCCSSHNKAFLENVWSCTERNRSCDWQRMGCLNKKAVP